MTQIKQESGDWAYFSRIVSMLEDEHDYQTRQNAIEELEQFIDSCQDKKYLLKALEKVLVLIDDPNFKICVTSTNILLRLSTF